MTNKKAKHSNAHPHHRKPPFRLTKEVKVVLMHLGFWSLYWGVELILSSFAFLGFFQNINLVVSTVGNLLSGMLFFYMLILFVLPKGSGAIRFFPLMVRLVVALVLSIAVRRGFVLLMEAWVDYRSPLITNLKFFYVSSIDLFSRFAIYAALIWFFRRQRFLQKQMYERELAEERLKHELLEAKHAVLQAQINPHFLFNTLNFLHAKAISSKEGLIGKTILLLSDILRHSLRDSSADSTVSVDEELDHIEKLCALNRLRFGGDFYVDIVARCADRPWQMPPYVLLTFFENAMKYGVLNDPQHPVRLYVHQGLQSLEIRLENKIMQPAPTNNRQQFAIGKRYVKNVLDRFYENNYNLAYHDDGVVHTVHLKINEG